MIDIDCLEYIISEKRKQLEVLDGSEYAKIERDIKYAQGRIVEAER